MLDLLQIPGAWRRPPLPPHARLPGPCHTVLYANGEADWEFTPGVWSTSGHWSRVGAAIRPN